MGTGLLVMSELCAGRRFYDSRFNGHTFEDS